MRKNGTSDLWGAGVSNDPGLPDRLDRAKLAVAWSS